jgi:hypothetical protein
MKTKLRAVPNPQIAPRPQPLPPDHSARDCDVGLLYRARTYSCSQSLALKWLDAVAWLRSRHPSHWILDRPIERKAAK